MNSNLMYPCSWSDNVRRSAFRLMPLMLIGIALIATSGCAGTGDIIDAPSDSVPADDLPMGSFETKSSGPQASDPQVVAKPIDPALANTAANEIAPAVATTPAAVAAQDPNLITTVSVPPADASIATAPGDQLPASARAKVEIGTGKFINEDASRRRPEAGAVEGEVVFNFEAESLQAVVKAILGELLQENYVIAPGLAGQVTFATAKPISSSQAMSVLEMLLAWNNATMVYKDGRYTVLPIAQAIPGNLVPRTGPLIDAKGYEVRVVPLRFISATAMQELLTPYARQGAILKADNTRSMIVLAGTRSDLENYLQTIETFDVDWLSGMSVGVYPLERVEAATVVPELEKIFGEGGPTPLAGLFRFMPIERINAVLVITPQSEYLARAEEWLRRLDRGGSESGAQLYVYYVKNVKAVELGASLTEVFGGSGGSSGGARPSGIGGVAPGQQAVELKSTNTGMRERPQVEPKQSLQPTSSEGISVAGSEDIRITSIEESNALMIRATPGEYEAILGAIKRLDIVPLQVHIEAKILRVDLTGDLSYGVQWFFENSTASTQPANFPYRQLRRNENARRQNLNLPLRNAWSSFAGSAGASGLAWTFLNTEAEALISLLQTRGNAQVLSAPSLVVLNNKTANINSGQSIPVTQVSFNSGGITDPGTGGVNNAFNQVQYRDTGITLDVTPRVNPGGLVYMEIKQEKSTPGPAPAGSTNPPIDKSTIQTEIAVQSGETVVLAGLIEESNTESRDGIPGLMSIPVLGRFFGTTHKVKSRQEILVLIKPTVIDNAESARTVTEEYKSRFSGLKPLLKKLDAQ